MAKIFSLFGEIFVDNEKANKAIDDTTSKGKDSHKSILNSIGSFAEGAVKIGAIVGGASTALSGIMTKLTNNVAGTADEIDKGSIRMGISTKAFQEFKYVAGQCGVELSTMEKAAKKLEGIDLNMSDAMSQIMSLGDATERAQKAQELFGDSIAYQLSPLIEQSGDDYNALIQNCNDLGIVMGEDTVKAGVKFGDTLSDLKQSIGSGLNKVLSALFPLIQKIMEGLISNMPQIQAMIDTLAPTLESLFTNIVPVLMDLGSTLIPVIFDIINQLMPLITQIIQVLLPFLSELFTVLLPPIIQIVQVLLPPLLNIITALMPLLQPLLDLLVWAINTILTPMINTIGSITNVISKGLGGAISFLVPVVKGLLDVFKNVFGAIYEVVKAPINFMIDGINLMIKGLNKLKIPDWVPGIGGLGLNIPLLSKLRVGIDYVPYDDMPALLHKGEKVLTADEVKKQEQPKETITNNYNNQIVIEKMEVRQDSDIKRIAEELYYLQKRKEV